MQHKLVQSLLAMFIALIGISVMFGGANGPRFLLWLLFAPFAAVLRYIAGGVVVLIVLLVIVAALLQPRSAPDFPEATHDVIVSPDASNVSASIPHQSDTEASPPTPVTPHRSRPIY